MQETHTVARKRQWGGETRTKPLPVLHDKPSTSKIISSRIAIVLTIFFWCIYFVYTIIGQFFDGPHSLQFTLQALSYLIIVTFLTFSALMYLISRQGAFLRFRKHERVHRAVLERHFATNQPTLTILIPSYSEEVEVIRKTLISAFLQEYPNKRIVLLIDDNPIPKNPRAVERLEETRGLAQRIMDAFTEPAERFVLALEKLTQPTTLRSARSQQERLIGHYRWAVSWLSTFAEQEKLEDHVDIFFTEQVLRSLARELNSVANALDASLNEGTVLTFERIRQLYCRLVWIFGGSVETFERKQYASLSHETNKAMNLNSYIGLMGGGYQAIDTAQGTVLRKTNSRAKNRIEIPDSEFVLTLDADSILLPDYCLRLIYFMELPEHASVAVVQTPYSAFRGAGTRLERLAGATTDLQHILHQGKTYYGATFWVGANAIIRKKALLDVCETERVNGFEIKKYIQDRTVIEDTESSIDLITHGWSLVNYPERLSYSATPPDFGSLIVQRRRWANGGLLILPKLIAGRKSAKNASENISYIGTLLRVNYMASIAWSSFGLLLLLSYPYDGRLLSPLVLLAAMPYFLCMASDLKYCGYKRSDVLRIYGFNLILLPVNLAGVLKSIQQAFSGEKIPFARTPKVKNRTVSPLMFVAAPLAIVAFSIYTFVHSYESGNWGNAGFAVVNCLLAVWAIVSYIGIGTVLADLWIGVTDWMYVEVDKKPAPVPQDTHPDYDWRSVLYPDVLPEEGLENEPGNA